MKKASKFQGGIKGAVYTCTECGKQTRETGYGESSVKQCKKCYYEGGLANEHSDYGHAIYNKDCPECREEMRRK